MKNNKLISLLLAVLSVPCLAQTGFEIEYKLIGKYRGNVVMRCDKNYTLLVRAAAGSQPTTVSQQVPTTPTLTTAGSTNKDEPEPYNRKVAYLRDIAKHTLIYVEGYTGYRYAVQDDTVPTWTLLNEQKKLGNYMCRKATTQFRGRSFTVWFTPEIPISGGPWKLAGLPGLILDASSVDGDYQYQFVTCTSIPIDTDSFRVSFNGPVLPYSEYVQKLNSYFQDRANRLSRQATTDITKRYGEGTVGPMSMKVDNIEKTLEKTYISH
jgi:GLPGLI family protein